MAQKPQSGKFRSRNQLIGSKGEDIFRLWANDRGLSPNKVDEDYGIDFYCEYFIKSTDNDEKATGHVIAIFVRSTAAKSQPRITLTRDDVELLLTSDLPVVVIGVSISNKKIYYRFKSKEVIKEWITFLASSKQTRSWPLEKLESDPNEFQLKLAHYSKPSVQHKLRIYKFEQLLRHRIPGASIETRHTQNGGTAFCELPWLGSAFEFDSRKGDEIRHRVFVSGEIPTTHLPGVNLIPEFNMVSDLADSALILSGDVERKVKLCLDFDGEQFYLPVTLRRIGDERAYVHPVGLCIVVLDPRNRDGQFYHDFQSTLFHNQNHSLMSDQEAFVFLEKLRPGALINECGRKELIDVDIWGLSAIGPALNAIKTVKKELKLPLTDIFLSDLNNIEFGSTLGFLEAALVKRVGAEKIVPGFTIEEAGASQKDSPPSCKIGMRIPVVMNFGEHGVVLWIEGKGELFIHESGSACGFRLNEEKDIEIQIFDKPFKKSELPEVWISPDWPPIKINPELNKSTVEFDASYVTLNAIMWRLNS